MGLIDKQLEAVAALHLDEVGKRRADRPSIE